MLHITSTVTSQIKTHAVEAYPEECCGILIGTGANGHFQVVRGVAAKNISTGRRRERYELNPRDFLRADQVAREAGLDIVGFYHSHPDHEAVASRIDVELGVQGYVYVIVPVGPGAAGGPRAWRFGLEGAEEVPLVESANGS